MADAVSPEKDNANANGAPRAEPAPSVGSARRLRAVGGAARALAIALAGLVVLTSTMVLVGYGPRLVTYSETLARFFFQPVAIVFFVALALEYLILKSADRSRLLQMELERLRVKRRSEISALRQTREGLERLKQALAASEANGQPLGAQIDQMIENLRPPETRMLGGESGDETERQ